MSDVENGQMNQVIETDSNVEQEQPVYEITQTDHVNAKLLSSFQNSIPSHFLQDDSDNESWEGA